MTRPTRLALVLALLATAGCGREVVGGGQKEVETVAVGDATPDGSASRAARASASPVPGAASGTAVPLGTLAFTAAASLVAEDGGVVPVTGGPRQVAVRLDGADRATVARQSVPDVSYVRARVVFTRVAADVTGGVLGVAGAVRVNIPAGDSVVVERAVAIPAGSARAVLVVDLDASRWLVGAVGGLVSPGTFAAAVRLRAE
ncbi:MAG TPA: hypothetical protein VF615_05965 [Longimicrobiaceae bacterium]|jgi:hypothetical protein